VKEVREVCSQTLKLFNNAKFCEDEKSMDNFDTSKGNISNTEASKVENKFPNMNAVNNKKSKKELVPIPSRRNPKDNLSPKNNATNNNSFQNNGKKIIQFIDELINALLNHLLLKILLLLINLYL